MDTNKLDGLDLFGDEQNAALIAQAQSEQDEAQREADADMQARLADVPMLGDEDDYRLGDDDEDRRLYSMQAQADRTETARRGAAIDATAKYAAILRDMEPYFVPLGVMKGGRVKFQITGENRGVILKDSDLGRKAKLIQIAPIDAFKAAFKNAGEEFQLGTVAYALFNAARAKGTLGVDHEDYSGTVGQRIFSTTSDVEIARALVEDLEIRFGNRVPFSEGCFWRWTDTHWEAIDENQMRLYVHAYDGAPFETAQGLSKTGLVINSSKVDGILHEAAAIRADTAFFADAVPGINCASGFIRFDSKSGAPTLERHDPSFRQRHVLRGAWYPRQAAPKRDLLNRLLSGTFLGDPEAQIKVETIAEVAAAAALGMGTKLKAQKVLVLLGPQAGNGKSQILNLLRAMLPPEATSTIQPAKLADEKYVINLSGKLLNAIDELSGNHAISSEEFKRVITGEEQNGRRLYENVSKFRPIAQHAWSLNSLPAWRGGMDAGVRRRLLVVECNRVIPEEERVEAIGQRIADEEPDALLAWVVEAAQRLIPRMAFPRIKSSDEALANWTETSDPVAAWLADAAEITGNDGDLVSSADAYAAFKSYVEQECAADDRRNMPGSRTFFNRLTGAGVRAKRKANFRGFCGLRLKDRVGNVIMPASDTLEANERKTALREEIIREIRELAIERLGKHMANSWMNTPHQLLEGQTPYDAAVDTKSMGKILTALSSERLH